MARSRFSGNTARVSTLTGVMTFGWCALIAGAAARLVVLSGRRITYNVPIRLRTEVGLQSVAIAFGAVVGIAGIAGLVVGVAASSAVAGWLVAVATAAVLSLPARGVARRLFERDLSRLVEGTTE